MISVILVNSYSQDFEESVLGEGAFKVFFGGTHKVGLESDLALTLLALKSENLEVPFRETGGYRTRDFKRFEVLSSTRLSILKDYMEMLKQADEKLYEKAILTSKVSPSHKHSVEDLMELIEVRLADNVVTEKIIQNKESSFSTYTKTEETILPIIWFASWGSTVEAVALEANTAKEMVEGKSGLIGVLSDVIITAEAVIAKHKGQEVVDFQAPNADNLRSYDVARLLLPTRLKWLTALCSDIEIFSEGEGKVLENSLNSKGYSRKILDWMFDTVVSNSEVTTASLDSFYYPELKKTLLLSDWKTIAEAKFKGYNDLQIIVRGQDGYSNGLLDDLVLTQEALLARHSNKSEVLYLAQKEWHNVVFQVEDVLDPERLFKVQEFVHEILETQNGHEILVDALASKRQSLNVLTNLNNELKKYPQYKEKRKDLGKAQLFGADPKVNNFLESMEILTKNTLDKQHNPELEMEVFSTVRKTLENYRKAFIPKYWAAVDSYEDNIQFSNGKVYYIFRLSTEHGTTLAKLDIRADKRKNEVTIFHSGDETFNLLCSTLIHPLVRQVYASKGFVVHYTQGKTIV